MSAMIGETMPCKRYVYERYRRMDYRTIPPTEINKPVRYRDEHGLDCGGAARRWNYRGPMAKRGLTDMLRETRFP
jgi:hypothetical protein